MCREGLWICRFVEVWVGVGGIVSSGLLQCRYYFSLAGYGLPGEWCLVQYWRALFWPPYVG